MQKDKKLQCIEGLGSIPASSMEDSEVSTNRVSIPESFHGNLPEYWEKGSDNSDAQKLDAQKLFVKLVSFPFIHSWLLSGMLVEGSNSHPHEQ